MDEIIKEVNNIENVKLCHWELYKYDFEGVQLIGCIIIVDLWFEEYGGWMQYDSQFENTKYSGIDACGLIDYKKFSEVHNKLDHISKRIIDASLKEQNGR